MRDNERIIQMSKGVDNKATAPPLNKASLDELISYSGFTLDMILEYDPEDGGQYLIYVKYNNGQIVRQVFTQRNTPRKFKILQRAIDWGAKMGFRSMSMSVNYDEYISEVSDDLDQESA